MFHRHLQEGSSTKWRHKQRETFTFLQGVTSPKNTHGWRSSLAFSPPRWWSNVASSPYIKTDGLEDIDDLRLLLKINDIYFLCAKPDIRIDEPIFSLFIVLPSYSLFCLQVFYLCLPSWHSHSLTPHTCVRVSECVCAWVSVFTNTHTHTHTPSLQTISPDTSHCALKRVYIR
jgi:hypothetical protein